MLGCERFFNLVGYVSSPMHTSLDFGVRTYEGLAMLSCLLRKVYIIDEEWIAQEYLRRCKAGISGKGKVLEPSLLELLCQMI